MPFSVGKVYKIVKWLKNEQIKPKLVASYKLENTLPVFAMVLWPSKYFYLSNKDSVLQYDVSQCGHYLACKHCIADPYCAWNLARNSCSKKDLEKTFVVG